MKKLKAKEIHSGISFKVSKNKILEGRPNWYYEIGLENSHVFIPSDEIVITESKVIRIDNGGTCIKFKWNNNYYFCFWSEFKKMTELYNI